MLSPSLSVGQQDASDDPIDFATTSLAWDETQEKLCFPLRIDANLTLPQHQSSWNVLVSRQEFYIGRGKQVEMMAPPRPVIPMVSTSAAALWHGLFEARCVRSVSRLSELLMGLPPPTLLGHHIDSDGASSNIKMIAAKSKALPERVKSSSMTCGNHRNQLSETAVGHVVGTHISAGMFSCALFLRMGSHWSRLLFGVPKALDNFTLTIKNEPPPPGSVFLSEELRDYLRATRLAGEDATARQLNADEGGDSGDEGDVAEGRDNPQHARWLGSLEAFLRVFNGDIRQTNLMHHCLNEDCCASFSRAETKRRMIHAIRDFLLRSMVPVPNVGKWTKSGLTVDRFVALFCIHNLLPRLMQDSFGGMPTIYCVC